MPLPRHAVAPAFANKVLAFVYKAWPTDIEKSQSSPRLAMQDWLAGLAGVPSPPVDRVGLASRFGRVAGHRSRDDSLAGVPYITGVSICDCENNLKKKELA